MVSKFIKLSVEIPGDVELINPTFITRIRKAGTKTIVYTMDGSSAYVADSIEEVMDKIKKSEMFTITTK